MTTTRILLALAVLALSACAAAPSIATPVAAAASAVPTSFLEAYPVGSQKRDAEDVRMTLASTRSDFHDFYAKSVKSQLAVPGAVDLAFAVKPDGTVEAVSQIKNSPGTSEFELTVLKMAQSLRFGAASGQGYYVFRHRLDLASSE